MQEELSKKEKNRAGYFISPLHSSGGFEDCVSVNHLTFYALTVEIVFYSAKLVIQSVKFVLSPCPFSPYKIKHLLFMFHFEDQ